MRIRKLSFVILFLCTACAPMTHWQCDTIAAGDPEYDSSRLSYQPDDPITGLRLDLFRMKEQVDAYLNAPMRRWGKGPDVQALFVFGDERMEARLPLREGKMRTKLPLDIATKAIETLQEGRPITIILDGMEETIQPELFPRLFTDWKEGRSALSESVKGPIR